MQRCSIAAANFDISSFSSSHVICKEHSKLAEEEELVASILSSTRNEMQLTRRTAMLKEEISLARF